MVYDHFVRAVWEAFHSRVRNRQYQKFKKKMRSESEVTLHSAYLNFEFALFYFEWLLIGS